MGNLIGEAIDGFLSSQIDVRQKLHGKGLQNNPNLTNTDLNLINNKNAWLKLASGVFIGNPTLQSQLSDFPLNQEFVKNFPEERLRAIGLDINEMSGLNLAKKTVLFNTLSEWDSEAQKYNFRSGIVDTKLSKDNVWNNNNAYGLGSPSKGLTPPPGLIGLSIENLNRGSIREANIEIKCFNKIQFEILELVYLRLGYHMIIEWGWDKYISDSEDEPYQQVGNTIIEKHWFEGYNTENFASINSYINKYKQVYEGNYDGFIGRVSNFDWTMDSDGSFNVQLKLMSTGDVIESLKVNLALSQKKLAETKKKVNQNRNEFEYKKDSDDFKSIIVSKAAESTLHYDLFTDLINKNISWTNSSNREYINIFQTVYSNYSKLGNNAQFYISGSNAKADELEAEGFQQGLDDHYGYFLTFGTFLNKLKKFSIPNLSDDGMISINTDVDSNICSVFPNQISLDPRVCFVRPFLMDSIQQNDTNTTYVRNTPLNNVLPFGHQDKTNNGTEEAVCVYGKIMNIYLNYDFIGKSMEASFDDENNIFLFTLLNKICNGVNRALGNITNLEVTLRNGNEVVIIDQNPIPGLDSVFPQLRKDTVTNMNLFGFNTTEEEATSNFVKDFKFTSKLTPKTSTAISIGATAGGTKTANIDVTGFANWNKGLEDNFAFGYEDPIGTDSDKSLSSGTGDTITRAQVRTIFKAWKEGDLDEYNWIGSKRSKLKGYPGKTTAYGESGVGFREVDKCPITKETYQDYTWANYAKKVNEWLTKEKNKNTKEDEGLDEAKAKWKNDYFYYLVRAFGGKAQDGLGDEIPRYMSMDKDFIKEGQKCFRAYYKVVNNQAYEKTGNPSNQGGFIPLDLSITCDGISGFKIYNALNIDQGINSLLPYQYKAINNFLIQKVNHKIENNDWETTLETLSIPKIVPPNPNEIDLYSQSTEGNYNKYNPGPEFTPTKQPWSAVFVSYVMKQAGVKSFKSKAAHRSYANAIYANKHQWRRANRIDGTQQQYLTSIGSTSPWRLVNPYRIKNGLVSNKIQDWFRPQLGDVFIYNRNGNTNTFDSAPWTGETHGDIITEVNYNVTGWTAKSIGGNLSNTSRFSPKTTNISKSWLDSKAKDKLFVVLRYGSNPNGTVVQNIAKAAIAEKDFWAGRKETVANQVPSSTNELFQRMTEYWNLVGIRPSQWGRDPDSEQAAKNQQKNES